MAEMADWLNRPSEEFFNALLRALASAATPSKAQFPPKAKFGVTCSSEISVSHSASFMKLRLDAYLVSSIAQDCQSAMVPMVENNLFQVGQLASKALLVDFSEKNILGDG